MTRDEKIERVLTVLTEEGEASGNQLVARLHARGWFIPAFTIYPLMRELEKDGVVVTSYQEWTNLEARGGRLKRVYRVASRIGDSRKPDKEICDVCRWSHGIAQTKLEKDLTWLYHEECKLSRGRALIVGIVGIIATLLALALFLILYVNARTGHPLVIVR